MPHGTRRPKKRLGENATTPPCESGGDGGHCQTQLDSLATPRDNDVSGEFSLWRT